MGQGGRVGLQPGGERHGEDQEDQRGQRWPRTPQAHKGTLCMGFQRDVVFIGCPIASSNMSQNAGGGAVAAWVSSPNEYSCTQEPK